MDRQVLLIYFSRFGLFAAIVGAWQYLGSKSDYWQFVFSSPEKVLARMGSWIVDQRWWRHLGTTLEEALLGYLLGIVAALLLVLIIGPSPWLQRFTAPFIAALHALPKVALAPLFIFWFGAGLQSKVYFVASLITFIVFHGVLTGLRSIDPVLVANSRIHGASKLELLRELYVPAVVTWIFASLRLSFAWSLLAAIVGEYIGSNQGIGYLIAQGQRSLQSDIVLAGVLVTGVTATLFDRLLRIVERAMSKWRAF